ncbi:MAG: FAD-dependent oxidoreductase [Deltaproteobacteria bacterium]|nr:FAD-dependent oxidoreductase [Deltaproteobacteria bacterium]
MDEVNVAVVGAGPAGLAAAVEAAARGASVVVIDENSRPGGQLFKQIHKFFGSREHHAGIRGIDMAVLLLDECRRFGVRMILESAVYGIFSDGVLGVKGGSGTRLMRADRIVLATGASENALTFPGWTLPGVMGAGALQTMMNVHRVLPGRNILMIGSGNVGLIVSYQALQSGARIAAVVEAAPEIGGYGVHAAKLSRAGVPILPSTTVQRAFGSQSVEGAEIVALDERWSPIAGSERTLAVDTICLSVGLTPLAELAWMAGCRFSFVPALGGHIPVHDWNMRTACRNIYAAGDITGIEEASTALEEGRLAGLSAVQSLGLVSHGEAEGAKKDIRKRLSALRDGPFGIVRRELKDPFMKGPWLDDVP